MAGAVAPSPTRVWAGRITSLASLVTGAWYLSWRGSTVDGTGAFGMAFFVTELVSYGSLVLSALLMLRARSRLEGPAAPPTGTLDVFVTVCGEPLDMVERTLRAALEIRYPHRTYLLNDGLVADKPGWQEVERLAARLDVPCFTRATGALGKAGNLNFALARTDGDFVATIDADHVAVPELAHETLGYLRDERVAFVCTPQRFLAQGPDVLNNEEPLFYRSMQPAKDADNCAFSCGNGTVYRRTALESIGGFSEWNLVEDLHTSYRLHAAGWHSVYHPRPITTGVAPRTAAVYVKQRMRWAMDSLRLLLLDSPLRRAGLSWRQRLHYFQTTTSYLMASVQLVFLAGPAVHILWRVPLLRASEGSYLVHALPYFVSMAGFLAVYCGARHVLKTLQLFVFNAPIYLIALVRTVIGLRPPIDPTEKARQPAFSLLVAPAAVAFTVLTAALIVAAVDPRPYPSRVAIFWAGVQMVLLAGPLSAISERAAVVRGARAAARGGVALLAAIVLLTTPATDATRPSPALAVAPPKSPSTTPPSPDVLQLAPPAEGSYLGVWNDKLIARPGEIRRWADDHGASPAIVQWFQQWRSGETRFRRDWMEMVSSQGAVPMVTWEPWSKPRGRYGDPEQPDARLSLLVEGRYDAYIRSWAESAADYGRPLVLRLMHEMNGWWYPWSVAVNGNTPELYTAAWRHVHDIFRKAGAANVSWVWSPDTVTGGPAEGIDPTSYYPGRNYVDWVGMSGFNWGETAPSTRWRSGDEIFRPTYDRLSELGHPVMIAETGTVLEGGDAGAWVRDLLHRLERDYPRVEAVVWYDHRYSSKSDFRLRGPAARSFDEAVTSTGRWVPPRSQAVCRFPPLVHAPALRAADRMQCRKTEAKTPEPSHGTPAGGS